MVNPAMIFKIKSMWDEFTNQHPKLPRFFQAVASQPLEEGTVIEMTISRPGGDTLTSNVKLRIWLCLTSSRRWEQAVCSKNVRQLQENADDKETVPSIRHTV